MIVEQLKNTQTHQSTAINYLGIWRQFNKFLVKLDTMPEHWEDRVLLYAAYLIDEGIQSSTLRSYISAIRSILKSDDYKWDDSRIELTTVTKACKIKNDRVYTRLPIQKGFLELILFELGRIFKNQPYLLILYRAMFALAYYGLMRVGELTLSEHTILAKDTYIGKNKDKIVLVLYTSKTHGLESSPQEIKISRINSTQPGEEKFFCPFNLLYQYMKTRVNYLLGGLSLHLNHLIESRVRNFNWQFGTLPFGLFWSILDTMDLETYPRTYSGQF